MNDVQYVQVTEIAGKDSKYYAIVYPSRLPFIISINILARQERIVLDRFSVKWSCRRDAVFCFLTELGGTREAIAPHRRKMESCWVVQTPPSHHSPLCVRAALRLWQVGMAMLS